MTSVTLPFLTSGHNLPSLPDNVVEILNAAQPQVLILPAGLAVEGLNEIKSIKGIVVVDISTAPHMDWSSEDGDIPVKSWTQLLELNAHHEPSEPAAVAVQSFIKVGSELKSIEFTHQVLSRSENLIVECYCCDC